MSRPTVWRGRSERSVSPGNRRAAALQSGEFYSFIEEGVGEGCRFIGACKKQ